MDPTSNSGAFTSLSRHEEYFINGGDLYLMVEHVTFRVHRYFFERESPRFQSQLMVPVSPGADLPGKAESNAIVIKDVKSGDFAKFLWVFYNPKYSLYDASIEDWTTILDLSQRWQFTEVKDLAVREIEKLPLPDVDRIAIYHKFKVNKQLLIPRYASLCERENPLSLKEGLQLGMETSIMIAQARELARADPSGSGIRSPTVARLSDNAMHGLVRDVFDIKVPNDQNATDPKSATTSAAAASSSTSPGLSRIDTNVTPINGNSGLNGNKSNPTPGGKGKGNANGGGTPATKPNGNSNNNGDDVTATGTTKTGDGGDGATPKKDGGAKVDHHKKK